MVLEISGRRRHAKRWRSGLTVFRVKKGSGIAGALFFCLAQTRTTIAPPVGRCRLRPSRNSIFPPLAPFSAIVRDNPRKGWRSTPQSCISRDETNQIIDELSPQSVIYAIASRRRRGTIGGGSTTGAPPINCNRLQVAEFRRPSHMDTGKPSSRAESGCHQDGLDAKTGASP